MLVMTCESVTDDRMLVTIGERETLLAFFSLYLSFRHKQAHIHLLYQYRNQKVYSCSLAIHYLESLLLFFSSFFTQVCQYFTL